METGTRTRTTERLAGWIDPRLAFFVLVLVGWQVASLFFPQNQFPGLGRLAENVVVVVTSTGRFDFVTNVSITVQRIVLGFVVAMVFGTALGIVMGIDELAERYLTTPVMTFLAFPALIWAFLGILWFGLTTYQVPVFVIIMVVTPYVVVNIWEGTKDIDAALVQMAQSFDAGSARIWRDIYLPALQPYLFATTRIAFSLAWKILLVAEIFGTNNGIGHIVNSFYLNFRADMIIAWSLPIMLLMFGIERVLRRVETRAFAWRPEIGAEITAEAA
ncbi:MAG: ABC transporter permease subunit [Halobacteriales archaeon]|nr:ABC transporter permease subunit [Halobacteriales archaeon]